MDEDRLWHLLCMDQSETTPPSTEIVRDVNGRFVPGTVGGPGRPPGEPSITEAIRRKLDEEYPEASLEEKRTYLEKFIDVLFDESIKKRNTTLIKEVIDRAEGKAVERKVVEHQIPQNLIDAIRSARINPAEHTIIPSESTE